MPLLSKGLGGAFVVSGDFGCLYLTFEEITLSRLCRLNWAILRLCAQFGLLGCLCGDPGLLELD